MLVPRAVVFIIGQIMPGTGHVELQVTGLPAIALGLRAVGRFRVSGLRLRVEGCRSKVKV